MVRARLAHLAVVVGLGLASGCTSSWSQHSLFSNLPGMRHEGTCCNGDGVVGTEGPILGESGPFLVPPTGVNGGVPAPVAPGTVPPLTAPPNRLVPQPQSPSPQAPPMPYNP